MFSLDKVWQFMERNNGLALLTFLGITVSVLLLAGLIKRVILRRFGNDSSKNFKIKFALLDTVRATRLWLLVFPAIALGSQSLELPIKVIKLIESLATIAMFLQIGIWLSSFVRLGIAYSQSHTLDVNDKTASSLGALNFVGQALLWSIVVLMALDNLGINVTALVAGLGVGGIAVALAVQNILGDLFASLSIIIDKPFTVGDFIIIGDYMGTVEHIGVKTTRVRSLGGEQIIFSNNDLLKSRVRNYKRMFERRVLFQFGVLYETDPAALEQIPSTVKEIICSIEKTRFDRAHFSKIAESSLDFEVVYWVLDADYTIYMDIQQSINLKLMTALANEKIGFAYPTRTLSFDKPIEILPRRGSEVTAKAE